MSTLYEGRNPSLGYCIRMIEEARNDLEYVNRNVRAPDYCLSDVRRAHLMLIEAHRTLTMYAKINSRAGAAE